MLERIKILIAMQLRDRHRRRKVHPLVFVLLRVLAVICITAGVWVVFFFFNNIMALRVDRAFLLFLVGLILLISVIGNTNELMKTLYLGKDNPILFALPANHSEVFLAKLAVFCIDEFFKGLYTLLPIFLAFGLFAGLTVGYLLNLILLLVLLPALAVLLGAVLSMPAMMIRHLLKRLPWLTLILGLVAGGFAVWGLIALMALVPVPLRLLALYTTFMGKVNVFISVVNQYLFGVRNLVNLLFAGRTVWDYLIVLGILAVLSVLVYFLAMPFYFRIVAQYAESTSSKRHRPDKKARTVFGTFCLKEIRMIFRTPSVLGSYLYTLISFPVLMYVVNTLFAAINTDLQGDLLVISFNVLIGLVLCAAGNSMCANAVSSEGMEFWVLKTAPSRTYQIAWAKILVNGVASALSVLLGFVTLSLVTDLSWTDRVFLLITLLLFDFAHLLWSFQFDLLDPHILDFAVRGTSASNPNVGRSVGIGLLTALILCLFCVFFFLKEGWMGGWIRVLCVAVAFCAVRLVLFTANLRVYFKRIEY